MALAGDAKPVDLKELPPFTRNQKQDNLARHSGFYPAPRVRWIKERTVRSARAIFPHPMLPTHAVLTTDAGARLTTDKGRTWRPLPGLANAKLGDLTWIAFKPDRTDAFYVGTAERGLWLTEDNGKTARQVATKKGGLLSDSITAVYVYPYELRFKTLLVTHGEAAAGISRSDDGGAHWDAVARKYHARFLLFGRSWYRPTYYMAAAAVNQPDVYGIHTSHVLGEYWFEMVRDLNLTSATSSVVGGRGLYWSTAAAGLLRTHRHGASAGRVGPEKIDAWTSVGTTYGPHADTQVIYAYAPTAGGLLLSVDEFKSSTFQSQGLFKGPYVAEGAMIRANGNGTVFYALVNGFLYRGFPTSGSLKVHSIRITPPLVSVSPRAFQEANNAVRRGLQSFARSRHAAAAAKELAAQGDRLDTAFPAMNIQLVASVSGRVKPAKVTVDLSRVGGSARTPLFDDGEHGDGAAGDKQYGCRFRLSAAILSRSRHEWRRSFPGTAGLTVTAVTEDGALAGAVGLFTFLHRPESFKWWGGRDYQTKLRDTSTNMSGELVPGAEPARSGREVLRLNLQGGPWRAPFGSHWRITDITGYHAISFWIKTDTDKPEELYLQLMDSPEESISSSTHKVSLVRGGHVQGGAITTSFRKVIVPLRPLLRGKTSFHPQLFAFLVFSGEGKTQRTYDIGNIRCHLTAEDLKKE